MKIRGEIRSIENFLTKLVITLIVDENKIIASAKIGAAKNIKVGQYVEVNATTAIKVVKGNFYNQIKIKSIEKCKRQ